MRGRLLYLLVEVILREVSQITQQRTNNTKTPQKQHTTSNNQQTTHNTHTNTTTHTHTETMQTTKQITAHHTQNGQPTTNHKQQAITAPSGARYDKLLSGVPIFEVPVARVGLRPSGWRMRRADAATTQLPLLCSAPRATRRLALGSVRDLRQRIHMHGRRESAIAAPASNNERAALAQFRRVGPARPGGPQHRYIGAGGGACRCPRSSCAMRYWWRRAQTALPTSTGPFRTQKK